MLRTSPAVLALLVIACRTTDGPARPDPKNAVVPPEVVQHMDRASDPCGDFYRFACGGWIDATALPADQPRFGRFHELAERNTLALRGILEEAATKPDDKMGAFWRACMDEPAIEARGLEALAPTFAEIQRVTDAASLLTVVGKLHSGEVRVLFDLSVEPDYADPSTNLAFLGQSGLGLPDREMYIGEDPAYVPIRNGYLAHMTRIFELAGDSLDAARTTAEAVVAFERQLAELSLPRTQMREPESRYHRMDRKALATAVALPWDKYFTAIGRAETAAVSLSPPAFFEGLQSVIAKAPPQTLRAYLRWHVLHTAAPHLPQAFAQENHAFFGRTLRGQAELAPRWKRCVRDSEQAIGELVGQRFVASHFGSQSKDVALSMIREVERAFEAGLPTLDWMEPATRTAALGKMGKIVNKIGYPEPWRDYSGLSVGEDHLANMIASAGYDFTRKVKEIDRPVDRNRWFMPPSTVNAYYNPNGNEMVFPAGILQPPFFDAAWPMAMNFGGIGMVMGHELTHGFDDEGRKFDGDGKLRLWWAPEVAARFEERAQCVVDLYSGFEVQPGVHLSGDLTLGENIADLGGIKQAHGAFLRWASENGVDPKSEATPGVTHEQLFFVTFSQIWCTKSSPENDRLMALTDPHSHPRYRVNAPLANYDAFATAFACEAPDTMVSTQTCEVW